MHLNLSVRTPQDMRDINRLTDFVYRQDLGYPAYGEWIFDRMKPELISGYKMAIFIESDGDIVADIIVQPHKAITSLLEAKNLRVSPSVRMRYFGRFLLKQVETWAKDKYNGIIVDYREEQRDVGSFLLQSNFVPVITIPLYDNKKDVMAIKLFDNSSSIITPITRKIESFALAQATRN